MTYRDVRNEALIKATFMLAQCKPFQVSRAARYARVIEYLAGKYDQQIRQVALNTARARMEDRTNRHGHPGRESGLR